MWGSMPLKVVSTSGNSGTFAQASFSEFVNQLFLQSLLLMLQLSHLEPLLEENDLHLDIRNITFKFLVPKFLNNVKIQEKSQSKATLHGNEDSEDDANRKFWKNYKKEGITDEVATKSLLNLKLHLDEINEKLTHHTYILGNELTLPDIAWFIYVSRLKATRYPIHILHPNVNDWYESLLKREVFAKETKISVIVRLISYIFYVVQKYSGWSIKRQLIG